MTGKSPTGRKTRKDAHRPTPEGRAAVSAMVSASVPGRYIAAAMNISLSTLKAHYRPQLDDIDAGKSTTAIALDTLIKIMVHGEKEFNRLRAAFFWLKTRENELFSVRQIHENIDRAAADELGKLTEDQVAQVAENVLRATGQNTAARLHRESPSIDDEPAGSA